MKTVYGTNSEVIDNWLRWNKAGVKFNGQNKNKSLYFEGNMLYSYGKHYPLARYIPRDKGKIPILVNNETSTPTTNNHKSRLLRFLDCDKKIRGFFIKDFKDMELNVSDYELRIKSQIAQLLRSRDSWWIKCRLDTINNIIKRRNQFVNIFKLDFGRMEFKELLDDKQTIKLVTMKLRANI